MDKEKQLNSDKKVLESLEIEYNNVRRHVDSVRAYITDLGFEDAVPDPQERYLMVEQLKTLEGVQTNLINRIRFYRHKVERDMPEPWEEDTHTHHCGHDADEANLSPSLIELVGMEVVAIAGSKIRCEGCTRRNRPCVKLELVGGDYICLEKPHQDEEDGKKHPVISFDEEEEPRTIMDDIKEEVNDFIETIDDMFKK